MHISYVINRFLFSMAITNIWLMAFDTIPKLMTQNYAMIYVFKSFLNKRVDCIGKIIGSRGNKEDIVKIQNAMVKVKGSSGYLALPSSFAGKKMRFYLLEHGSKERLDSLRVV